MSEAEKRQKINDVAEILKGYAVLYESLKLKDGVGSYYSVSKDSPVIKAIDEALIRFLKKTMEDDL